MAEQVLVDPVKDRVKVISSHTGHARFLAEVDDETLGYIDRQRHIPSPYAYSPNHLVYQWNNKPIIIVETRHKRYEVFQVPTTIPIRKEDI